MPRPIRKTAKAIAAQRSRSEGRPSINPLKKRIRDLKRLLGKRDDLPADVRIGHERELASCQHEVEVAERKVQRSRMIKKYHMVRFFERKNATKQLKRAHKALESAKTPEVEADCAKAVHEREVDLNYTLYFPLHLTYYSLYANARKEDGAVDSSKPKRDNKMWQVVEEAMKSGKLQALRDGKLEGYREDEASIESSQGKGGKKRVTTKENTAAKGTGAEALEESDDDDGKGFFE